MLNENPFDKKFQRDSVDYSKHYRRLSSSRMIANADGGHAQRFHNFISNTMFFFSISSRRTPIFGEALFKNKSMVLRGTSEK